ncbi:MAG: glycerophosphodiester phosphodiesterase family protein [Bacteroidetes bacterium]|nr:glycerophosphodiester phosphodiesterase family protein [Bacteroidota bacterium]
MKIRNLHVIVLLMLIIGCNKESLVPVPSSGINSFPEGTLPVPSISKPPMEGIYLATTDATIFGDTMILKWNHSGILFTCKNGKHFIMNAGYLDSVILIQGYWRDGYSDATGLCNMSISGPEGGNDILTGKPSANIILRGAYGANSEAPDQSIMLQYIRPFSQKVKSNNFYILGHRAGGRNSDRLPVSENSIAMVKFTERLGTTGIEVDPRISSDGVAFIYHDPDINTRLTQKGLLAGDVSAYTWLQLSSFVKLIHGERIPSLEEVLTFAIDSTELRFVYMDMKSAEAVPVVIPIQQRAIQHAKDKGRDIIILMGIPGTDVLNALMSSLDYRNVPSLCELTVDDVRMVNSKVWAPRWTLGIQNDLVQQMHNEGRLAVCWTIDSPNWIRNYLDQGIFDGLVTNFPYVVAYHHYIQE